MRVFVSSTGEDLKEHRNALLNAILRLGWQFEAMEHFGADPRRNLRMCQERVARCDVTVVVVAHRYGSPVPTAEGGDGRHSYTWYELQASKQVFGYLVDPQAPWTGPKENDLITADSTDAEVDHIRARMGLLKELKDALRTRSCASFTSPDDLAQQVVTDLSRHAEGSAATPRAWSPRYAHALQPAPAFAGRQRVLAELAAWWTDPGSPDRLIALVAPGGTGKTAIVERHLRAAGHPPAGLFVWSFYEDPDVDHFLREAASYLLGRPVEVAGAAEALKDGLRGEQPHVLVLDGLERIQHDAGAGRVRGELEDPRLRTLLRLVAAGTLGRARLLLTTRFPLRDLDDWLGRGYRAIELDDLDPPAARGVLRSWGVRGDDPALDRAAARVGRHALSVSVLGSFLAHYRGGDPEAAHTLNLELAAGDDPASGRLLRLVLYYRDALTAEERQVMGWLSTFPRGAEVALLGVLARDGRVAGVLVGCEDLRLVDLLRRLERLGLVFPSQEAARLRWSAHPFLRDHFRRLLGVPEADVWAVAEEELGRGLERRPAKLPTEEEELDRYEALIEAARGAGRVVEAFELYWYALGSYNHLGRGLGMYTRGLRITSGFPRRDDKRFEYLNDRDGALLAGAISLFFNASGDIYNARKNNNLQKTLFQELKESVEVSIALQNLVEFEHAAGCLTIAAEAAAEALTNARVTLDPSQVKFSLAYNASVASLRGDLRLAETCFAEATKLEGARQLYSKRGLDEADFHFRLGDPTRARTQTEANLEICTRNGWGQLTTLCHDLLARCALPDDPTTARAHLAHVRRWATRTGEVEMVLRAHRLAAALALAEGDRTAALAEAEEGLTVADGLGFGLLAIDLRLLAARAADPARSLTYARAALDASTAPECGYAWGEADAAHLCGLAHLALGEPDLARRRLTQALAVRQRIRHPGLAETERALARVPGVAVPGSPD
jgi:hypothetical protein